MNSFEHWCLPAKIYAGYVIVMALLHAFTIPFMHTFFSVLVGACWVWILNWVCQKGYRWITWGLVAIPLLVEIPIFLKGVIVWIRSLRPTTKNISTEYIEEDGDQ